MYDYMLWDYTYFGYRQRAQVRLIGHYLDYYCNFLTVAYFAKYLGMDARKVKKMLTKGKALHACCFGPIC